MKKLTWLLSAVLFVAACSPQVYPLHLGVRQPSESGLTLVGKTASIVYMDGNNQVDSLFDRQVASALARALEADYFNGQEVIGLSRIASPDSVGTDLMHNLVMETGGDVIFLLNSSLGALDMQANKPVSGATSVDSAYVAVATMPVQTHLYVYDSMDKDEVKSFKGSTSVNAAVFNSGIIPQENLDQLVSLKVPGVASNKMGELMSKYFLSTWKTETFAFYGFDDLDSYKWFQAVGCVEEGKFTDAIKIWEPMVKSRNKYKAAHACYNMAMAFYLLGDMQLASRWLDQADSLENVSQVPSLRKRIARSLEK